MKRFGPDPEGTRLRGSLLIAPKIVTNTMRPSWTFSSSYARKGWADFSFSSSIFFFQHRGKTTQQIPTTHLCKSQVSISFFICSLSKLFQCWRRGTMSRRNIGQHRGFASLIHQTLCRNFLLWNLKRPNNKPEKELCSILRDGIMRKNYCSFGFCPNYLPSPQFWQLVQLFLNAKNIDLSDIQNDTLSKILLKVRQNTCFVGHLYNLEISLKFKLLAFGRK